jgi:beta-lactamase class A
MQSTRSVLAAVPDIVLPIFAGTMLTVLASPQSASADTLQTWKLDTTQNRLEFTTDQAVQPIVQFVQNPSRITIDLPGIRWTKPKLNQPQKEAIQSLRIAKFEPTVTRMVIDLAPGMSIDPNQVIVQPITGKRWTVQLPKPIATANDPTGINTAINPVQFSLPQAINVPAAPAEPVSRTISLGRSMGDLQQRLASLKKGKYASLDPGAFILDLDNGDYASVNGIFAGCGSG